MIPIIVFWVVALTSTNLVLSDCRAANQKSSETGIPVRYSLPPEVLKKPYSFAGEVIPLQRSDVSYRIATQVNFLLLDARSVLIEWLIQRDARGWILKEILEKEGVPREFVLFAPVLPGMARNNKKVSYAGIWFLNKPCDKTEGVEMEDDVWHDDRMDIKLATRCFASRIKSLRGQINGGSWLMAAAAYVTTLATIRDAQVKWDASSFWDIPLPPTTELLICRWIALAVIDAHRQFYSLNLPPQSPLAFEQLVGIRLSRDVPIAEIARFLRIPAREILAINPKIKPANPVFPAKSDNHRVAHTIQVPKGQGPLLMEKLRQAGYLIENHGNK